MKEKVYIIILNWNHHEDTIECLESVFLNEYRNYQVIVCDNASTDNSMEKIRKWADGYHNIGIKYYLYTQSDIKKIDFRKEEDVPLILIENEKNLGYAGGNNIGIQYTMGKNDFSYIWILNNDTVVEKMALTYLVKKAERNPEIGLCGSLLHYYYEPERVQAINGVYNKYFATSQYNTSILSLKPIDYVVGASMLISKQFIEDIGLLSEEYFLYYEELDWVMRAKGKYIQAYATESIVYHKEGATIGGKSNPLDKSELADFYSIKNRIVFTKKYFPYFLPTVYLGIIVSIINRIRRRQFKRVKMILKIIWKMPESYFAYKESDGS